MRNEKALLEEKLVIPEAVPSHFLRGHAWEEGAIATLILYQGI